MSDKVAIYDSEGVEYLKHPIDARECVQSGVYFYERPTKAESVQAKKVEAEQEKTVAEKETTTDEPVAVSSTKSRAGKEKS